jgi:hypothetical protein
MNNAADIKTRSRIFDRGDFSNVPQYGTVTSIVDGHVTVAFEDGTVRHMLPVALFRGPNPRLKVVMP